MKNLTLFPLDLNKLLKLPVVHYAISSAVSAASPYILLLLYTLYLTPNDFGQLSLVMSVVFISSTLCAFGSGEFLRRELATDVTIGPSLLKQIIQISSLIALVLCVIFYAASTIGLNLFNLGFLAILSGVLIGYGRAIFSLALVPVQMAGRSFAHASISIVFTIIVTILTLILLISFEIGWFSRVFSEIFILSLTIIGFLIFYDFLFKSDAKIAPKYSGTGRKFSYWNITFGSVPIGLTLFINACYVITDRMLLSYFFDFDQVGLYTFNLQIAAIFGLFLVIVKEPYTPVIYELCRKGDLKKINSLALAVFAAFIIFGVLIYFIFLASVKLEMWGDFNQSISFAVWVMSSSALNNFLIFYMVVLFYIRKNQFILFSQVASLIANIVLSILLIEHYGPQAIAIGTFIASMFTVISIVIWGQKNLAASLAAQ